ncbi:MAG: hypothetical protein HGA44_01835 [Cellulomonadaceae bacterium]|nr:hypothetical protein [Cellulomonadaceae bacterium]
MTRNHRRSALRLATIVGLFVVVLGAGALTVSAWLTRLDAEPLVERCAAVSEGTSWYLAPDQADTAALVAGTSLRRGLPARATTIALATGLQESKLRNIEHGDRDSVGIFQQRPSQGWGTVEQILDPVFATNAFFDALVEVDGYEDLPITEAAQAVQRSGFPDAYAQHEALARAWASALYGYSPGAVTCTLPDADGPGDPAAVVARIDRDLGLVATVADDGTVLVDASPMAGAPADAVRLGWAVAHWAVAVASPLEVVEVSHAGSTWVRSDAEWSSTPDDVLADGQVRITLAG